MRISIFGLGYVGAVSAACLARDGHEVIGVDRAATKVALINAGRSPIIEAGLDALIADAVTSGRLSATTEPEAAVRDTQLSIVCVGTPSASNGSLDLRFVDAVCAEIGAALQGKAGYHTVVMRSTILPGTMRGLVIPKLEAASGKRAGADFGLCNNPEFLREGTAIHDYDHPPKTVIGAVDERSAEPLRELYGSLPAPLIVTGIEVAELVKYVDNVWHALKVGFANEIGAICKPLGIDSHAVMEIFCRDTKLNISPYYLKPGFAFGGSCLPKDVRALNYEASQLDLKLPIIGSIIDSNRLQIERALELIMAQGRRRIGILGFSFKAGTDDLRESPVVELIERLIGKGYELRLYDRNVNLARLVGANREYILEHIPHIERLMVDSLDELLAHAELVVVGNPDPEFRQVLARRNGGQRVIDLVRIEPGARSSDRYEGLSW